MMLRFKVQGCALNLNKPFRQKNLLRTIGRTQIESSFRIADLACMRALGDVAVLTGVAGISRLKAMGDISRLVSIADLACSRDVGNIAAVVIVADLGDH